MTSLKQRLTLSLTLTLGTLLVLQWALVSVALKHFTESQLAERLEHEAESLLASIETRPNGEPMIDALRLSSVYQRPFSGHYFAVCKGQDCQPSRSLWDYQITFNALPSGEHQIKRQAGPNDQQLMVSSHGYRKQGHALTVIIAEDMSPMLADMRELQWQFSLLSAAGLLLLLLVQWGLIQQSLRPLQAIRQQLQKLGRGESEQIRADVPDEIMPVVEELNRLLSTLTRKTRRSRQALGNLAHSLKSKLTLFNQIAESQQLDTASREAIYQGSDNMRQVIERELKRARLLGAPLPGQRVDLRLEVADLSETLQRIYRDKSLQIQIHVDPQTVFGGDREDLLEMLGNVLDNAAKWAKNRININIYSQDGVVFEIADDGPGCTPETLKQLAKRGFRADENVPGSGLGLAIVFDIVDSYGGSLDFSHATDLHGLKVVIRLP